MKVFEIYEKYEIPKMLQNHMLRVGAVARIVMSRMGKKIGELDEDSVMQACLLHDLGNIVKFVLDEKVGLHLDEDLNYLRKIQAKFIKKYGTDDHEATEKILQELGVNKRARQITGILCFEPDVLKQVSQGKDWEMKIVLYADSRISPTGILSVEARMADLEKRYVGVERIHKLKREIFEATKEPVLKVARQIETMVADTFPHITSLTNADLEKYFAELLEYNIPVNAK